MLVLVRFIMGGLFQRARVVHRASSFQSAGDLSSNGQDILQVWHLLHLGLRSHHRLQSGGAEGARGSRSALVFHGLHHGMFFNHRHVTSHVDTFQLSINI